MLVSLGSLWECVEKQKRRTRDQAQRAANFSGNALKMQDLAPEAKEKRVSRQDAKMQRKS
jgi:hypothetical protein